MKIDPHDKKRRLLTNVHGLRRQLYMSANVAAAPLRIPCGSAKQAQKLRFGLYASARVVKQNPDTDPEFLAAAENVIATVEGETVVLTRSELTEEGRAATEALLALGLTPESGGVHSVAARVAEERAMRAASGQGGAYSTDNARNPEAMDELYALYQGINGTTAADLMPHTALKEAHFPDMPEFPAISANAPPTLNRESADSLPLNPYPRRNTLKF